MSYTADRIIVSKYLHRGGAVGSPNDSVARGGLNNNINNNDRTYASNNNNDNSNHNNTTTNNNNKYLLVFLSLAFYNL